MEKIIVRFVVLVICFGTSIISKAVTPVAPQATLISISANHISLKWDSVSGSIKYQIASSTASNFSSPTFKKVTPIAGNYQVYSLTRLSINKQYYLKVRACNASVCSAFSDVLTAKTASVQASPSSPDSQSIRAILMNNQAQVTWEDVSSNELGFRVEHSISADFTPILSAVVLPPGYTSANLGYQNGVTNYYRVRSYNNSLKSDWAKTLIGTPGRPISCSKKEAYNDFGSLKHYAIGPKDSLKSSFWALYEDLTHSSPSPYSYQNYSFIADAHDTPFARTGFLNAYPENYLYSYSVQPSSFRSQTTVLTHDNSLIRLFYRGENINVGALVLRKETLSGQNVWEKNLSVKAIPLHLFSLPNNKLRVFYKNKNSQDFYYQMGFIDFDLDAQVEIGAPKIVIKHKIPQLPNDLMNYSFFEGKDGSHLALWTPNEINSSSYFATLGLNFQVISSAGTPLAKGVLASGANDKKYVNAKVDSEGNFVVVWGEVNKTYPGSTQLFAARLLSTAGIKWGANSTLRLTPGYNSIGHDSNPAIEFDLDNNVFIAFSSGPLAGKGVIQKISKGGTLLWGNSGFNYNQMSNTLSFVTGKHQIFFNSQSNALIVFYTLGPEAFPHRSLITAVKGDEPIKILAADILSLYPDDITLQSTVLISSFGFDVERLAGTNRFILIGDKSEQWSCE